MISSETDSAEQRFREAFSRLKDGKPERLPRGTPVSQNNVAKEAGTDPSALRKSRYPSLVREIQAWVEITEQEATLKRERRAEQRRTRNDLKEEVKDLKKQRDEAQSQLVGAHSKVLALLQENLRLKRRIDEMCAPPTPLQK